MSNDDRRNHNQNHNRNKDDDITKNPDWRRQTPGYRARRGYVRDLWIYSGCLIIFMPLSLQVFCLAALSFLSLSILDAENLQDGEE